MSILSTLPHASHHQTYTQPPARPLAAMDALVNTHFSQEQTTLHTSSKYTSTSTEEWVATSDIMRIHFVCLQIHGSSIQEDADFVYYEMHPPNIVPVLSCLSFSKFDQSLFKVYCLTEFVAVVTMRDRPLLLIPTSRWCRCGWLFLLFFFFFFMCCFFQISKRDCDYI